MGSSGPTQGAGRSDAPQARWDSYPGAATALKIIIWVLPLAVALGFTWTAGQIAPPEKLGLNRWLWIVIVFAAANLLLSIVRRLVRSLTPLVALMQLTLVFPDHAPSRAKATLRRSSSRSMLRRLEEAKAEGEASSEVLHSDYLVQLLAELNEHDRLTRGHSERVRAYSEMLGEELGLSDDDMNKLRWAALLHDVGKLDVPSEILNKPGRPTDDEWKVLSNHPAASTRMLAPLKDWLGDWVHAADQHHCRWDGKGYPSDLAGDDIALSGRIVAVADAYDVMTSARSYKKPLPAEVARRELTDCAGTQFDPAMVRAFLSVSLGRLQTVAGPFGWFANLIATIQVKIPIVSTIGSGVTSATAMVTVVGGGLLADAPPTELAMTAPPPPVEIVDDKAVGDEDRPILVTLSARGGEGRIEFKPALPGHGRVSLEDGPLLQTSGLPSLPDVVVPAQWDQPLTYMPNPDFNGSDSFTVEACDAGGRCDSAVVRVEVRSVNDAPAANTDRATTDAGQAVEIDALVNDGDVDGDLLTIISVEDPPSGQAILADGKIMYVPDPGFVGRDEIRYIVADSNAYTSTGVIVVTVAAPPAPEPPAPVEPQMADPVPLPTPPPTTAPPTTLPPTTNPPSTSPPTMAPPTTVPPVNQPPVAADDSATTAEDNSIIVDVMANDSDPDGDSLVITGLGSPTNGSAVIDNGRIRYQPYSNYHGPDSVTYVLSDGVNPQVVADLTIDVTPVNDPPILSGPSAVTILETAAVGASVLDLTVIDVDGDSLALTITTGDPGNTFAVDSGGAVTVAAALDFESTAGYNLNFEVDDGQTVTSHLATVTIGDVNEPPVAADDSGTGFTTTEDTLLTTGNVTFNDGDQDDAIDPASITIVTNTTNGALVDNGDGTFDYDPDPEWSGTDSFSYTVTDPGTLVSNQATVTIVVDPVNDAPNVTDPGARQGAEQMPFSLQVVASDVELDSLSFGAAGLPAGLTINATGLISGSPDPGTHGSHSVDVTVTDDGSPPESTVVSFTLDVGYHEVSTEAGDVVINEVLYNTVSVVAPEEFVELHNPSGAPVDISGWVLADANLKATGPAELNYTVPATDHWGNPSTLPAGGYAVIWLMYDGANLPPLANPAGGLEFVVASAGYKLDNNGDDIWLLDPTTAIVDYMAYGGGAGVGTPPEAGLGLWDATHQASLLTAAAESIVVTPNGGNRDDSACWEIIRSDAAGARCTGAASTFDSGSIASLATSLFKNNNAGVADAGGPYAIDEGQALVLDGSSSQGATSWNWDLDNDGSYDDATTASPSVPWSTLSTIGIGDDGVHPIGVEVNGGDDTDSTTVTISNVAPILATTGTGSVADGGLYTLNLVVTDPGDDTISSWTINWGDGSIETIAGSPSSVTHTYNGEGLTYNILASASDEDVTVFQNEMLVPGYLSDEIYRFAPTSGALTQEFGTTNRPVHTLIGPDGNLYVSGQTAPEVLRYNATTGAFIDQFVGPGDGGLTEGAGMAFGPDGHFYLADTTDDQVRRYDGTTGAFIDVFATTGLSGPYGLIFGPDLNLYVGEYYGDRVRRFDGSTGTYIDMFVAAGAGGLDAPEQIVFGPDGNLYVASSATDEVLRFDGSTGAVIDTFIAAGAGGLNRPAGVVFGPDGNLYVSDLQDNLVIRYNGTTGAFIDEFTVADVGGANEPAMFTFVPGHQVTITP